MIPSANYYFGESFQGLQNLYIPIGLAYQTYQSFGFLIDVYKSKVTPTKNLINSFLFISYFPQLAIGPISKYSELAPQFENKKNFNTNKAIDGIGLITYGLLKKFVVSETFNPLYKDLFNLKFDNKSSLFLYFFTPVFLYCDFSSFFDIARGISKIIGIDLPKNFQSPLTQTSVGNFWSKWHITLYRWLRDYLYYPLLNFNSEIHVVYFWIILVYLFSGFWHGLEPKFVISGLIAALLFLLEKIISRNVGNKIKMIPPIITKSFLHLYTYVAISFLTFNYISPTVNMNYFLTIRLLSSNTSQNSFLNAINFNKFLTCIIISFLVILIDRYLDLFKKQIWHKHRLVKWALIYLTLFLILVFYTPVLKPYIYFFS